MAKMTIRELIDLRTETHALAAGEYPLVVGYRDAEEVLFDVVKLTPLTGRTEEAISDKAIRSNFGKQHTALIAGIVVNLRTADGTKTKRMTKDIARALSATDRDLLILYNRHISIAEVIEFPAMCPNCETKLELSHPVFDLTVNVLDEGEEQVWERTVMLQDGIQTPSVLCKEVTIKRVDGACQEAFLTYLENPGKMKTAMLSGITVAIEGITYKDPTTFGMMTHRDRGMLMKALEAFPCSVASSFEEVCPECDAHLPAAVPLEYMMGE